VPAQIHEMAKPFARGADDEDMNRALRDEVRADDPMKEYILKQQEKQLKAAGVKVKPKYKGNWPPNRYMIPPGHRWDGRDRCAPVTISPHARPNQVFVANA
jgi:pre-mRNA-splicing factor CWC26